MIYLFQKVLNIHNNFKILELVKLYLFNNKVNKNKKFHFKIYQFIKMNIGNIISLNITNNKKNKKNWNFLEIIDFKAKRPIQMIFKNIKLISHIKIIKLHIILEIHLLMEQLFTIHHIVYLIQKYIEKIIDYLY